MAALLLRRDGHHIVHAAICRDDALGLHRVRRTFADSTWSVKPRIDKAFIAALRAQRPDLVVSWFWTKKLPKEVLTLSRLGALGVHPSLLPRHRGPDPYFWAIAKGDTETGVSAHWLEAEYDTGAVIAQRTLPLTPSWNAWELAKALDRPSLSLLREVVGKLAAGASLPGTPQDERFATPAPSPTDEELEIDWNWTCAQIAARIRAAAPAPGVFTEVDGREFVVVDGLAVPLSAQITALVPGEMACVDDKIIIRAADGGIHVRRAAFGDDEPQEGAQLIAMLTPILRAASSAPM